MNLKSDTYNMDQAWYYTQLYLDYLENGDDYQAKKYAEKAMEYRSKVSLEHRFELSKEVLGDF